MQKSDPKRGVIPVITILMRIQGENKRSFKRSPS